MTSVASAMMTEEEKAEMERELNGGATPPAQTPSVSSAPAATEPEGAPAQLQAQPSPTAPTAPTLTTPATDTTASASPAPSTSPAPPVGASSSTSLASPSSGPGRTPSEKDRDAHGKKRQKMSPEQKKKLQELDDERRKNMEERVRVLTEKLKDRLRPFVEAKKPGDKDDPETQAFETRMRREADDLKLESFGVEVCVLQACSLDRMCSRECLAATYDWQCLHHEGDVIPQVEKIPRHVRVFHAVYDVPLMASMAVVLASSRD